MMIINNLKMKNNKNKIMKNNKMMVNNKVKNNKKNKIIMINNRNNKINKKQKMQIKQQLLWMINMIKNNIMKINMDMDIINLKDL